MPKASRQSIKARLSGRIDDYWLKQEAHGRELSESEVELRLRNFGLDPFETELIMAKYVEGKKMEVIVKEQGWLNISSVNYYLRKIITKLRDGKFTFR